jgi:cephalosporin hydroxylase
MNMNNIIVPDWPIAQKKYEILALQELLKKERIKRVLEIGTWSGGTALLWAKIVSKYEDGIVYCCDLSFKYGTLYCIEPGTELIREYPTQMYTASPASKHIVELQGDSHDPAYIERVKNTVEKESLDFMFIDGDHSYEGVKQDFFNFSSLVKSKGYIAFHDITDSDYHRFYGVEVKKFWEEIKNDYEYWEFIDNNEYWHAAAVRPNDMMKIPSKCMGIGVIKKK